MLCQRTSDHETRFTAVRASQTSVIGRNGDSPRRLGVSCAHNSQEWEVAVDLAPLFVPSGTPENSPPIYRWEVRRLTLRSPGRDDRCFARRAATELQPPFADRYSSGLSSLAGLLWPPDVGPTAEAVGYYQPSLPGRRGGVLCPQSRHKTAWPSHLKFAQDAHKSRISSTEWASSTTEESFQPSAVSRQPENQVSPTPTGSHSTAQGRDALVAHPGSKCGYETYPERVPHGRAPDPNRCATPSG